MAIEWSDKIDGVDWHELERLYRAAPLGDKKAGELELVFANSRYRCFAFDGGRLVGAGRVLADGRDCAYLCDVAVLPSHQRLGIGREIVTRLVALSRGHKKIILYSVPGKEPLYRRFGFRPMTTAMAIFDDPETAAKRGYLGE